jgi:hypothetical protein
VLGSQRPGKGHFPGFSVWNLKYPGFQGQAAGQAAKFQASISTTPARTRDVIFLHEVRERLLWMGVLPLAKPRSGLETHIQFKLLVKREYRHQSRTQPKPMPCSRSQVSASNSGRRMPGLELLVAGSGLDETTHGDGS